MRKKAKSTFGTVEKRGHNVYRIKWTGEDGVRHSKTVKGPRMVADRELAAIRLKIEPDGSAPTYSDYWRLSVRPSMEGLAESTIHGYESTWRRLSCEIGSDTLDSTDWRRVQEVLDTFPSPSSQKKAYVLWRKILNQALRDRLVTSNPVDRYIRLKPVVKRKKTLLLADQVLPWMEAIEGVKYEPLLLTMIGGGLRAEEANALLWEDISEWEHRDSTYAVVSITKAVVVVGGRVIARNMPKNESSRRDVVIGNPFARRLLELADGRSGPLCPSGSGGPTSPITVTHNWKRWCKRNGIEYVSQKDLRSSYATNMGEAMAPDSVVSRAMGHAGTTTKERNYQQSTMRGLALIADMYEYLIFDDCP